MRLLYITNDENVAKIADESGIDIIFIDLETIGKDLRQIGRDTVKSKHNVSDIVKIKRILKKSKILVRVNPIHENSKDEIEKVVEARPDIIMLPMINRMSDVTTFLKLIDNRIKTCLLIETSKSVELIEKIIKIAPNSDYYIGLNDLHLSYGQDFIFEPLADGTVEKLSELFNKNNIEFGFGGIARVGQGMLPSESIIMEHYRLNSKMVILSRTFCNAEKIGDLDEIRNTMASGVSDIREFEKKLTECDDDDYIMNKNELKKIVYMIKEKILAKKDV